jgi:hypothetical protein
MQIMKAVVFVVLLAAAVAALAVLLRPAPADPRALPPARQQFDRTDLPWQAPPTVDPDNLRGF